MTKHLIICYQFKENKVYSWTHDYAPATLSEALGIGHELTRDFVADAFKVIRVY